MKKPKTPNSKGAALLAAVFVIALFGLSISNIIYSAPEISYSERRPLEQMPPLFNKDKDGKYVFNTDFMDDFEDYALDNFIGRDDFRSIKAFALWNIFAQKDNNGIYISNGYAAEILDITAADIGKTAEKLARLIEKLPQNLNVYYSLIPDKGYFLAQKGGYPALNYDKILEEMALLNGQYIDIFSSLSLEDYYKTDLHWDQSMLLHELVPTLLDGMSAPLPDFSGMEPQTLYPFYGGYKGQAALPLAAEELKFYTGGFLNHVTAKYLNPQTVEMEEGPVYHTDLFDGIDPYDVFLKGVQPIITLENPEAKSDKHLVIFRDSYSSSLAPLLADSYSKITLIDLRYVSDSAALTLVDFSGNCDVLFLYSVQILSDSTLFMVSQ